VGGGEQALTTTTSVSSELVERSQEILNDLIHERRALRTKATDAATLEANRLAIVYWQQHLSRAVTQSRSH
jgi:hypothetical protein